ncbi:MAG: YhjD/YihY/BrkB family envelope integrity protein [Pseudomonadota bacterium]
MIAQLKASVEAFLWNPRYASASLPVVLAIRALRFVYALARDSLEGQITLRAMSLVYTSLLSLVPLVALSFSILKGLKVHEEVRPLLYNFLAPLGPRGDELTDQFIGFVDRVNGVTLSSVGLFFLLYTVISMVQKVEESLNFVWQVSNTRSLGRRFTEYLSVIVIAPLLMALALGMLGSLESNAVVQRVASIEPFGTGALVIGKLGPYLLVTLVFSFIYAFVPNTRVTARAALTGGLMAGLLWATIGRLFASFVATASSNYTAIYSTFAIAMLALFWLYINWLILLIGAKISYYAQNPDRLRRGLQRVQLGNRLRERLAITVMYLIGADFRQREPGWSINAVASHLRIPADTVAQIVSELSDAGLLVITEQEKMLPAREMDSITVADILAAVRAEQPTDGDQERLQIDAVNRVVDRMEASISDGMAGMTLRSLVAPTPVEERGSAEDRRTEAG